MACNVKQRKDGKDYCMSCQEWARELGMSLNPRRWTVKLCSLASISSPVMGYDAIQMGMKFGESKTTTPN